MLIDTLTDELFIQKTNINFVFSWNRILVVNKNVIFMHW
jgi:hypothetical protein